MSREEEDQFIKEAMEDIARGKAEYRMTQTITLPPFISNATEVYCFFYPDSEPNFITMGKVSGEVCLLEHALLSADISDK